MEMAGRDLVEGIRPCAARKWGYNSHLQSTPGPTRCFLLNQTKLSSYCNLVVLTHDAMDCGSDGLAYRHFLGRS